MRSAAVDVEGQNDLATVKKSIKKSRDLSGKRFRSFVTNFLFAHRKLQNVPMFWSRRRPHLMDSCKTPSSFKAPLGFMSAKGPLLDFECRMHFFFFLRFFLPFVSLFFHAHYHYPFFGLPFSSFHTFLILPFILSVCMTCVPSRFAQTSVCQLGEDCIIQVSGTWLGPGCSLL